MQTLFIRADASSSIGLGHVMRCLALGQAWQDRWSALDGHASDSQTQELQCERNGSVCFICAKLPESLERRLRQNGCSVVRIKARPGSDEDLRQTRQVLNSCLEQQPINLSIHQLDAWIVIDGYSFGIHYQRGVRSLGCKLLVVDDYNHLDEYESDILLNQNLGADRHNYNVNSDCRLMLGTRYSLLRREFRDAAVYDRILCGADDYHVEQKSSGCVELVVESSDVNNHMERISRQAHNVLVTMGGADPNNVTMQVVEALNGITTHDINVKIVVGAANPHGKELIRATSLQSSIKYQLLSTTDKMPDIMKWADIAISSGGSTCWELCFFSLPMVLCILADNQRRQVKHLVSMGAACYGEEWTRINSDDLRNTIEHLLDNMKKRSEFGAKGRMLVDAYGVMRVREAMSSTSVEELTFRSAMPGDVTLYLYWANDPVVRANCFNPDYIQWDDHLSWFKNKVASNNVLMLIAELNGLPVGQVRYYRSGDEAVVGVSIDSDFRGMGVGLRIIRGSVEIACEELGVSSIRAEVFTSNISSKLLFEKAGFKHLCSRELHGVPCEVYYYSR